MSIDVANIAVTVFGRRVASDGPELLYEVVLKTSDKELVIGTMTLNDKDTVNPDEVIAALLKVTNILKAEDNIDLILHA